MIMNAKRTGPEIRSRESAEERRNGTGPRAGYPPARGARRRLQGGRRGEFLGLREVYGDVEIVGRGRHDKRPTDFQEIV